MTAATSENSVDLSDLKTILERGAAVTLHQPLQSSRVEDAGQRIYPPTFPDLDGYFIDTLSDNATRAIIDTKQSQARRLAKKLIEINDAQPLGAHFLPQVIIRGDAVSRRVGEIGHRVADAAVLLSTDVGQRARAGMNDYNHGDSTALGTLFPESLLFGFWDSHSLPGGNATRAKRSRVIHSEIHACDVSLVRSKSVYVAAAPELVSDADYEADKSDEKLSEAGLANAISKTSRDGVLAKSIVRSAEINLAALRQIACRENGTPSPDRTRLLQSYLFHLALLAVGCPHSDELNLRSGTLLVPLPGAAQWTILMRDGSRFNLQLPDDLCLAARQHAGTWFKAVTGSETPPAMDGNIPSGTVANVRKSLKGKAAKKTKPATEGIPEAGE